MTTIRLWNSWGRLNTGRKPVRSLGTVIRWWMQVSLHLHTFFRRVRVRANNSSSLSIDQNEVEPFNLTAFWCCKCLKSALFGAISSSQLILEHLWSCENWRHFPVDSSQRFHTLRADRFRFWTVVVCISSMKFSILFLSVKLLFTDVFSELKSQRWTHVTATHRWHTCSFHRGMHCDRS